MAIPVIDPKFSRNEKPSEERRGYIRLRQENFSIVHPDSGKTLGPMRRDFMISRNVVAGIIYCPDKKRILMARQFRMPVMFDTNDPNKGWIFETIAGVIDDGEHPVETFVRETEEEAGILLDPGRVEKVAEAYSSPGISSEKMHIFTCKVDDCVPETPGGGLESEGEAIVCRWLDYQQVRQLRAQNRIQDLKTLIGLMSLGF